MGTDCGRWNEMKVAAPKFNCKSSTESGFSWQRSVKRKFEGLNLCRENLISEEQGAGSAAEHIVSEDILCRQIYQQPDDALTKELTPQPTEEFTNSTHVGELGQSFMSKQHTQNRTHGYLRLAEETEPFISLRSNAQYSASTSAVENMSPSKLHTEKKGAFRNVGDREAEFRSRLIEVENEVLILREALRSQHQALQDLYSELEEERNASSTAANEALSMILRLQAEKAAVHMEARQFKRMADEKLAHDQESLTLLEDLMYRKDQEIAALECEVQAYRHRLLSVGFDDLEIGKIRWPGRSYTNEREGHLALSDDCGSWADSCPERLEGFDGDDSVGFKTPNTIEHSQGRDMLQRQDNKGKRHVCKNESVCLDEKWNEGTNAADSSQPQLQREDLRSWRVIHGQDRTLSNSHRVQAGEYSISRKMNRDITRGYTNHGNDSYPNEGMDFDCKGSQAYEKSKVDLEAGIGTSFLNVQDDEHEMAMNTTERSPVGDNLTLWERIERLEDRLQQLSRRRMHNHHLDDEWIATSQELQKTIAAYTVSLREGSKSRWRLSLDKTGICDGLTGEAKEESVEENPGLSTVCEKGKPIGEVSPIEVEVSCSGKGDSATNGAEDESDGNFSVHDVYVIQHDCGRTRRYKSHKGTVLNLDLEDEDRLGKPEPLPQRHQEEVSCQGPDLIERKVTSSPHHETQVSRMGEGVCSAESATPMESRLDTLPLEGEVKQLSTRLQALEGDREFMKQAIDSLAREKEELRLLKEIAQQLRELKAPTKSLKVVKNSPRQEDASFVTFMKGILSFNVLRSNTRKNMDIGLYNNVGLPYLLEKAPTERMSTCITRVMKVDTIIAARTGHLGQATEDVLFSEHSVCRLKAQCFNTHSLH